MSITDLEYEVSDLVPDTAIMQWTEEDGLPARTVAWAEADDFGNPHGDFQHTKFVAEGTRWAYNDDDFAARIIREYRNDYVYNEKHLRKRLLKELEPLAIERFDFGDYGSGTMWAFIPDLTPRQLLGDPKYWDVAEWLHHAQDRKHLKAYARRELKGDIASFKVWDEEGSFYIRAANLRTGEQSMGVGGVVDPYPYKYALECAIEEAREVA
ncbi:hypothetical protein GCM10028801_31260 [Nocardioides maradonensis]